MDLASIARKPLETMVDTALDRRLVTFRSIERYILERGLVTPPGVAQLVAILDDREQGVPGGELEREFLPLIERGGLPLPARQHRVGGRKIDFAYPDLKVAIELDGRVGHSSPEVFEDDRQRQNALVLDGWLILRFTWKQVTKHPDFVIATIKRAIEARSRGDEG